MFSSLFLFAVSLLLLVVALRSIVLTLISLFFLSGFLFVGLSGRIGYFIGSLSEDFLGIFLVAL
jgi:hypothetical protein